MRLTKGVTLADDVELKLDGGISRTITGRKAVFTGANDPDTGSDAGYPTVSGRVGLTFPVWGKRPATFGISGHRGGEEMHQTDLRGSTEFQSWSANADLRLPLTASLLFQAEAFIGRNLDTYLGGIGQGLNSTLNRTIGAAGGWASLTFTPVPEWQFNVGGGTDDPNNADLTGSVDPTKDARTANSTLFGNVLYSLNAQVQLGFELGWLRTTYKVNNPGVDWRQQLSVTYKF